MALAVLGIFPEGLCTRFVMQGWLLLESWLNQLTGPALKSAEGRMARREVDRLKHIMEAN